MKEQQSASKNITLVF
jgi:hypothetical protein